MVLYSRYINLKVHETTLPLSASEGQMVEATSAPLEQGSLPVSVRHPSKESKAEETHKKGKMIRKKQDIFCIFCKPRKESKNHYLHSLLWMHQLSKICLP